MMTVKLAGRMIWRKKSVTVVNLTILSVGSFSGWALVFRFFRITTRRRSQLARPRIPVVVAICKSWLEACVNLKFQVSRRLVDGGRFRV